MKPIDKNRLIDLVLEQIKADIAVEDYTALAELLYGLPVEKLTDYLPDTGGTHHANF